MKSAGHDFSVVAVDKFIQATRDSGYKGTASAVAELIDNALQAGATEIKVALANVGVVDPTSLADYRAQGGMAALRKVLREMTPQQVIAQVKASKLLGRGGAAFSAGLKWELAARHSPPT